MLTEAESLPQGPTAPGSAVIPPPTPSRTLPRTGREASAEEGLRGPATCSPVVWQWITRMLAISANLTLEGFFLVSFRNSPRTTSHLQ